MFAGLKIFKLDKYYFVNVNKFFELYNVKLEKMIGINIVWAMDI